MINNIDFALQYATDKHNGQLRKDGTPYICHPIRVAENVEKFKRSKEIEMLMECALLHDTIEDTNTTFYDIVDNFGIQVANIVMELTNDEYLKNTLGKTNYLKHKLEIMSSWALVIKLCDRLDNVSDLNKAKEKFKNKYFIETYEILNNLINNRKLSNTHINIINQIIDNLSEVDINEVEKDKIITLKKQYLI